MAKYSKGISVTFTHDKHSEYDTYLNYSVNQTGYIHSVNEDGTYNVNLGLTLIPNVPEDHIYSPLGGIDRKVEEYLNDAQKNKQFKDTEGRIGGSAKEKAAFRKIAGQMYTLADVDDMDSDPNLAIELIKKEKVLKKPDPVEDMDNGVSPSASFYKQRLYGSFAAKPAPNKTFIKAYVGLCQYLNEAYKELYDLNKLSDFSNEVLANVIPVVANAVNKDVIPLIDDYIRINNEYEANKKTSMELSIQYHKLTDKDSQEAVKLLELIRKIDEDYRSIQAKMRDYRKAIISSLVPESKFKNSYFYELSDYARKLLIEIGGKSFYNYLFRGSDAVEDKYREALMLDAVSEESYQINKVQLDRIQQNIDSYEKLIEEAKNLKTYEDFENFFNNPERKDIYGIGFTGSFAEKLGKKIVYYWHLGKIDHKTEFRDSFVRIYSNEIEKYRKGYEEVKKLISPKGPDWSWISADKKKSGDAKPKAEIKINTYPPLESIERKGGLQIDEDMINEQNIVDLFGFKTVQFGQSIKDFEAKAHIKHFLGAITDFADVLDVDIAQLNRMGGLSIAFAARGKGKALAHYEPLYKIINLTKVRGGGALAHEYMHYIDNLLPFHKNESTAYAYNEYASSQVGTYAVRHKVSDERLNKALKNIFDYIYKGIFTNKQGQISKVENTIQITILAGSKVFKLPALFYYDENGDYVEAKDIETYLKRLKEVYRQYEFFGNFSRKDFDVLGAIVTKFGYKSYDMTFKINASRFYVNSKKMSSPYWIKPWELFARGFETYIFDKLNQFGRCNTYLVSGIYFDTVHGVYPQGEDRENLFILYDNFFDTLKLVLELKPFSPFTDTRVNEYVDLSGKDEKVEDELEVENESEEKTDKVPDSLILSQFGSDILKSLQKYEQEFPDLDRVRLMETVFDIKDADNVEKIKPEHFFEALLYETGYSENFKSLKDAIDKGGIAVNADTIKRMIDVGVDLPKSIVDLYEQFIDDVKPEQTGIKATLRKLSEILSTKMGKGGRLKQDFSPLENLKNKIINL